MADDVEKKETEETPEEEVKEEAQVEESAEVEEKAEETPAETVEEPAAEETEAEEATPEEKPEKKKKSKKAAAEKETAKKKDKDTLKKKKIPKVNKVALFNQKYMRDDIPKFKAGDTIRVHYQIIEGDKTRVQVFEGVCIARKHSGLNETITVRKMSGQIGVERTFFVHSRRIEKIEVKKIGKIRRAKIYFLRGKVGKQARIREAGIH